MRGLRWIVLGLALWSGAALAIGPDELLPDPMLEARARELSKGIRCPVCQNESIDESDAPIAGDLRALVRERLVAGDSDGEVRDHLVARYGEFILLEPDARGANLLLWIAGPTAALLALIGIGLSFRRRSEVVPLTEDEQRAVAQILQDAAQDPKEP